MLRLRIPLRTTAGLEAWLCAFLAAGAFAGASRGLEAQEKSLPQQIADEMVKINGGVHTGFRYAHAKGMVLTGTFTPTKGAASISRAAHFHGAPVPVTVRLSDATGVPQINDDNPNASPRGMAIRFNLPTGAFTDIVSNSHNGFFVGTGEDFLALVKAIAGTTPESPHPSPIEQFLGSHPRALKVVVDSKPLPKSFATLGFFGNNAFIFVDSAGTRRAGRYQILPVAGIHHLGPSAAKLSPNYMFEDLTHRIVRGPIKYRLLVQLANPGDQTNDGSIVWPDDRKRVEMGTITLTKVAPNNQALQRSLTFNPIYLTDGIQLSDDPFVPLRSAVYALSVAHRH
ncbi:MAG: catalase family peroxidase [Gemmatimonadales bacterium]